MLSVTKLDRNVYELSVEAIFPNRKLYFHLGRCKLSFEYDCNSFFTIKRCFPNRIVMFNSIPKLLCDLTACNFFDIHNWTVMLCTIINVYLRIYYKRNN